MTTMTPTGFTALGLDTRLLKALEKCGYTTPTPIQEQTIPIILEGKDLQGCAQTGTGKTAAFLLPILHQLTNNPNIAYAAKKVARPIRVLILCPTRELAIQIGENLEAYSQHTHIRHAVIYGGVRQGSQINHLRRGPDILVATPGRLFDLMNQGYIQLDMIETLILDEADRMLDMGFIHDIRKVVAKIPPERQTLFFSATMPPDVQKLANSLLKNNKVSIAVTPTASTAETIEQQVYFVAHSQKQSLLHHLLKTHLSGRVLIFSRTKHGADRIVKKLQQEKIHSEAIHADKSQYARQNALQAFKNAHNGILVATDIAARGIDVDDIRYVINFDLPDAAESYVHRIGRTGRAGSEGVAITFCTTQEANALRLIERTILSAFPLWRSIRLWAWILQSSAARQSPAKLREEKTASEKILTTNQ